MKESNILVGNVVNNFLRRDIWLNIKGQYMKESNTLASNVTIKHLNKDILQNTKVQ